MLFKPLGKVDISYFGFFELVFQECCGALRPFLFGCALSRDLCVSYKCVFVLLHKLREAMAEEMKGRVIGGEGKVAEVDGGYFGGYVKPANQKENRRDRRLAKNQNGKRKVVVIVRERGGNSLPAVFKTKLKPFRSFDRASLRAPRSTLTKR